MSGNVSALVTKFLALAGASQDPKPPPKPQVRQQPQPKSQPEPPTPKTEKDFQAAMREAIGPIEIVRGLAAVNDRAAKAMELMEAKLAEAIDAADRQEFGAGIAALGVATAQCDIVSDERVAMRTAVHERQDRLGKTLADFAGRIGKLAPPVAEATQALATATDAEGKATAAADAEPEDWPAAVKALDTLEKAIADLGTACTAAADGKSTAFGLRFAAVKDVKPIGAAAVKARATYLAQQKKLTALIAGKDGLAALELCPAVDTALTDCVTKASPTATQKTKMVDDARNAVTALSDDELAATPLAEKAELMLNLCANGRPPAGPGLDQLCRLYRASPPDPAFLEKREEERAKMAQDIAKIPALKKVFDASGRVNRTEWNKVIADPAKVQELLQEVSKAQLAVLGLPPVTVTTYDRPPANGRISMGGCTWTDGPPTIDLNANPAAVGDVNEALITIVHETYHAQQDILVKRLMAGDLPPDDPMYPQVLMFAANRPGTGYLPPSVSVADYEAQPLEIDAEIQGTATKNAILLAMKRRPVSV